jgi:hypothetical protein
MTISKANICRAFIVLTIAVLGGCSQRLTEAKANEFFDRYASLQEQYSVAMIRLFSDNAKVILSRRTADESVQFLMMSGAEWKATIAETIDHERSIGDYSSYEDVSVQIEGATARISAKRYSNLRCYYDEQFYLVVQMDQSGELEIIEMRADTQAESSC